MIRFQAPVEYTSVSGVDGPLLFVRAEGVGWDEQVEIHLEGGEVRHGQVLEVERDLAVVQVFEGSAGIRPDRLRVAFLGEPLRIPIGEGWLGRVFDGRGDPLDGGPPVLASATREVTGRPINPARRDSPRDPIITGISAIDALATLVRGQKLPIFSVGGLPHLELAAQVAAQASIADGEFCVIFAAMGLTHADADMVRDVLERRAEADDLALFLNLADDPVVERTLTPRIALTVAEHLAFDLGRHVLVVIGDMTSYCEAVRETAAARGEIPGRRGYPGYLYSDLASIYERCGRIAGRPGSITQLPFLTMPAGDLTHPVPDLTGYITEGQLVLSGEVQAAGVYPPFDALSSLSRLMRHGVGAGRTREDHHALANQIYAGLGRAREARDLSEMVGRDALSDLERTYLAFADEFQRRLLDQRQDESRDIGQTLELAWQALAVLPSQELTMLPSAQVEARLGQQEAGDAPTPSAG